VVVQSYTACSQSRPHPLFMFAVISSIDVISYKGVFSRIYNVAMGNEAGVRPTAQPYVCMLLK